MTDKDALFPHTQAHKSKGDWNPVWDKLAELDAEFLEAYLAVPILIEEIEAMNKANSDN